MIHATAQIDAKASVDDDVEIGAYSVIGADVEIGAGSIIAPHVVLQGPTRIGKRNHIHPYASIGGDAQDKKYSGERTELIIGDDNVIREFVTINRGTGDGGGVTRIGNDNWFLSYVHIAHDCQVGHHTVFSNNASLAGHVEVGDWVIMAGFSGVHQFCKIGTHAFIGMGCLVGADVPPFVIMGKQEHGRPRGINSEGLKRRGFESERIAIIRRAFRTLYMAGLPLAEACERLAEQSRDSEDVREMLDFIARSERSLKR
jgi:UDP-N-acetylglucosamine acyltransferase